MPFPLLAILGPVTGLVEGILKKKASNKEQKAEAAKRGVCENIARQIATIWVEKHYPTDEAKRRRIVGFAVALAAQQYYQGTFDSQAWISGQVDFDIED